MNHEVARRLGRAARARPAAAPSFRSGRSSWPRCECSAGEDLIRRVMTWNYCDEVSTRRPRAATIFDRFCSGDLPRSQRVLPRPRAARGTPVTAVPQRRGSRRQRSRVRARRRRADRKARRTSCRTSASRSGRTRWRNPAYRGRRRSSRCSNDIDRRASSTCTSATSNRAATVVQRAGLAGRQALRPSRSPTAGRTTAAAPCASENAGCDRTGGSRWSIVSAYALAVERRARGRAATRRA